MTDDVSLRRRQIVWIGGGAAAGKSTISNLLSEKYDCQVYHCDREGTERALQAAPGSIAYTFRKILQDDDACRTFYDQSVGEMISAYAAWAQEDFDTLYEEVVQISRDGLVIVEGSQQLAASLLKGKVDPRDCVYLYSTSAFVKRIARERTWYLKYTDKASNPAEAARNMRAVMVKGSEEEMAECKREGFRRIITGGRIGIEEACKEVELALDLANRA